MIQVVVVDMDPRCRTLLAAMLEADPDLRVAQAASVQEALARVAALAPGLVVLDLELPGALEAIERIMARHPVPILVLAAGEGRGAAAVSRGAMAWLPRPLQAGPDQERLLRKVHALAGTDLKAYLAFRGMSQPASPPAAALRNQGGRVVAIASSTGGPQALQTILSALDAGFPAPVVIAQHIGEDFSEGLVAWLRGTCPLKLKEAAPGDALAPGMVLINPPGSDLRIGPQGRVKLTARDEKNRYRPSCDTLLLSVAETYGERSIGVILSGMGDDGVRGMLAIRRAGGATLAQDEATSVVYGMNGRAVAAGAVEQVLPLGELAAHLGRLAGTQAP